MANNFAKTTGFVVREAAKGYYNARAISGFVSKKYASEFEDSGMKKGQQIYVKRPAQYLVRLGATYAAQDLLEAKIPVTLGLQQGVDFSATTRELTLDAEAGRANEDIQNAGAALASYRDAEIMALAAKEAGFAIVTAATPTLANFLSAKAILNKMLAPKQISKRGAFVGSDVEAAIVNEVKVLYNGQAEISKAIKEGTVSAIGGLVWSTSDLAYVRTNGAGGGTVTMTAITANAAYYTSALANGYITLTVGGAQAASLVAGDSLEFNSYFVNPETKLVYANKLQRKVLTVVDATHVTVDPIYPVVASPTTAEERGWAAIANCSVLPTTIAVLGTAGTKYLCSVVLADEAIAYTSVPMVMPDDVGIKDRIVIDGTSIRYLNKYDEDSDTVKNRLDNLGVPTAIHRPWIVSVETPLS